MKIKFNKTIKIKDKPLKLFRKKGTNEIIEIYETYSPNYLVLRTPQKDTLYYVTPTKEKVFIAEMNRNIIKECIAILNADGHKLLAKELSENVK